MGSGLEMTVFLFCTVNTKDSLPFSLCFLLMLTFQISTDITLFDALRPSTTFRVSAHLKKPFSFPTEPVLSSSRVFS